MRKLFLLASLFSVLAGATVTCKKPDGSSNGSGWTYDSANYTGNCGSGVVRPVWYYVSPTSYNEAETQTVFNDAWLGDRIVYTAGAEYQALKGIDISQRRNGTGKLLITTTEYDKLPAIGTRITPAYAPLLPKFTSYATKLALGNSAGGGPHSFTVAGGMGAASHLEFRGLSFEFRMTGDNWEVEAGSGPIQLGSTSQDAPLFDAEHNRMTQTRASITINVGNTIPVQSADGFEVLQSITVGGSTPQYNIAALDRTARTLTVCSDGKTALPCAGIAKSASASTAVYAYLSGPGDMIYQPDDITIRHCLALAPPVTTVTSGHIEPLRKTGRGWALAAINTRALTLADNYVQIYSDMSGLEPKGVGAFETYGPQTITNNYWFGGMSVMYGGAMSVSADHILSALWMYNTMHSPQEALMNGFDTLNVNQSVSAGSSWLLLFGPNSLMRSDITVVGLPANSPRFVMNGRSIYEPSSETVTSPSVGGPVFWNALNSGVVGTTKPACFANGGLGTGKIGYCYDGDATRPGTTYCRDGAGNSLIAHAGDGVCWRLATANGWNLHSTTKNSWESKSSSNITLQYNVIYGFPPNDGGMNLTQFNSLNAKLTNIFGNTTLWPGITPGCFWDPVKYAATGGRNQWPECYRAYMDNFTLANNWFKNVWSGPKLTGNYTSGSNGTGAENGHDWIVKGNLFTMLGPSPNPAHSNIAFGRNGSGDTCAADAGGGVCPIECTACPGAMKDPYLPPVNNVEISNNTWYTPFQVIDDKSGGGTPFAFSPWQQGGMTTTGTNPSSTWDVYSGTRIMAGNVWARYGRGTMYVGTTGSYGGPGEGFYIPSLWPGTTHADNITGALGYWGKHILLGAAGARTTTSSIDRGGVYPGNDTPGLETVWTGCGANAADPANFRNTAACSGGGVIGAGSSYPNYPGVPDYTKVFVNPARLDFRIKNDHWGKRAEKGGDLGADPDQVPMIKSLLVQPTDRSVLFTWKVTPVIESVPCVVELHTAPDFETTSWAGITTGYQAELTQLLPATNRSVIQDANGNNVDSDAHDKNYRDAFRRMLIMGSTVSLTQDSDYYYKLHCGGDISLGTFHTKPTLAGTMTQRIIRRARFTGVANMLVEYGTSYSRTTDTISGGGTATASCTIGNVCNVSFTATKGTILYYRWKERDSGNAVLLSGNVEVTPAM